MIGYSERAESQIVELRQYYEDRDRDTAIRSFYAAMDQAERKIEANPAGGLRAPRAYPGVAVFYGTADIPNRL